MSVALVCFALAASPWQAASEPAAPFTIERQSPHEEGVLTSVRLTLSGEFSEPGVLEVLHLVAGRRDPSRWHLFARRIVMRGDTIDLSGPPGSSSLIVFRDPSAPGYGLHGPFAWPSSASVLTLAPSRTRTVRARAPSTASLTLARWMPADGLLSISVECRLTSASALECLGVSAREAGVVIAEDTAGVHWSAAASRPTSLATMHDLVLEQAPWAALFQMSGPSGGDGGTPLEATLWRSRRSTAGRSTRLMMMPLPGYQVTWLTPVALWITGAVPEPDAVLQIAGPGVATSRIALGALRLNLRDNPVAVALDGATEVVGRVVTADGRAVSGALVTISEIVDAVGHRVASAAPGTFLRRLEEAVTDDEGLFVVNGLDQREYEWLAVHPQLGRAAILGYPDSPMSIRLEAERTLVGRVTSAGAPVSGVPVLILPLLEGLATSDDPLQQIGQESRSDSTGRFLAAVPSRAAGEIRIGSNATGIVRRRFGLGASRVLIDLGDIELRRPSVVRVLLDGHDGCDIGIVGPLGRVGMQVIAANRDGSGAWRLQPPESGTWSLVGTCSAKTLTLEPAMFEIKPDDEEVTVRVVSIEQ